MSVKCTVFIDKEREQEVIIYAHGISPLVSQIKELVSDADRLVGYCDSDIAMLSPGQVCCFTVKNNKVWALCRDKEYMLEQRLYMLEDMLDESFVKINQSTIANIGQIERFDASISGTLCVIFKNGYKDYVSRRQLKTVKERCFGK